MFHGLPEIYWLWNYLYMQIPAPHPNWIEFSGAEPKTMLFRQVSCVIQRCLRAPVLSHLLIHLSYAWHTLSVCKTDSANKDHNLCFVSQEDLKTLPALSQTTAGGALCSNSLPHPIQATPWIHMMGVSQCGTPMLTCVCVFTFSPFE